MRRIELLLGVGTALAAIAAIFATIWLPTATTSLSVEGRAPVVHHIYARDNGLVPMLVIIALIAALGTGVLPGAYFHSQRGSAFGRTIVLTSAASYVVVTAGSIWQGAFAVYPAMLALLCALFALLPSRRPSGGRSRPAMTAGE
jgi:hypothetical protein